MPAGLDTVLAGPVVLIDATMRHTFEPTCSNTAPAHYVTVEAVASPSIVPPPAAAIVTPLSDTSIFLT